MGDGRWGLGSGVWGLRFGRSEMGRMDQDGVHPAMRDALPAAGCTPWKMNQFGDRRAFRTSAVLARLACASLPVFSINPSIASVKEPA
jgi:hypothetical protein